MTAGKHPENVLMKESGHWMYIKFGLEIMEWPNHKNGMFGDPLPPDENWPYTLYGRKKGTVVTLTQE